MGRVSKEEWWTMVERRDSAEERWGEGETRGMEFAEFGEFAELSEFGEEEEGEGALRSISEEGGVLSTVSRGRSTSSREGN
jgi:hypothetical protein